MGQNKIKAFATDGSANVLTDDALASRSELQTGFLKKSKADSALIGKLMQNATASAYAVGEFSAKYGTTDITGSDATGFATAFESALESYIDEKAPTPDLSIYATKENATLTGTATLNGQSVATVNQIPDVSHFVTDTTIQGYAPLAGAAFTGAVTVQEPTTASNPATKQYVDSAISSVYKYRGSVANQSALPSSNQTIGDVYNVEDTGDNFAWDGAKWDKLAGTVDLSSYLTITSAQSTYQPKGDYATSTALTEGLVGKANAVHTHAISDISDLQNQLNAKAPSNHSHAYLSTSGGTISGNLTVTGALAGGTVRATSDARLKSECTTYDASLKDLEAYRYKLSGQKGFHVGLIAQDVQKVIPEAVEEDSNGYLSLDYNAVVAVLVNKVNSLESRLSLLEGK